MLYLRKNLVNLFLEFFSLWFRYFRVIFIIWMMVMIKDLNVNDLKWYLKKFKIKFIKIRSYYLIF